MAALDEKEEDEENNMWTLEETIENINVRELTQVQKDGVYRTIFNARKALSQGEHDIGEANVNPHQIELLDYTHIWQKPRNFTDPINEEIDGQCCE